MSAGAARGAPLSHSRNSLITPPAGGKPWRAELEQHWAREYGEHAERAAIMANVQASLADSTAAKYDLHFARFERWCDAQPDRPSALPALRTTVMRWVASDVCPPEDIGRVKADSLRPYTAAINTIHKDFDLPEPATGHLWRAFKAGLKRRQSRLPGARKARRVYLPPPIVERVMEWALERLREPRALSSSAVRHMRAAVAVVLAFAVFVRGDTGSAVLDGHVRRSAAGVTVTLAREKGKELHDSARTLTLPPGAVPGLEQLLDAWEALRGPIADGDGYFSLSDERRRRRGRPRSTLIDTWLKEILSHLGLEPPAGETWSGHSLRKGAASGAAAIGAALHVICYMGGWSVKGAAVHDYIDPTCPASAAARRFFGWLRPPSQ